MYGVNKRLHNIYTNLNGPGAYFGDSKKLLQIYNEKYPNDKKKIKLREVENFLAKEISYSIHRNARKNYQRNTTYVPYPGYQFACDLADMRLHVSANDGYKYILFIIDSFSRFVYAEALLSKSAENTLNGFKKIMKRMRLSFPPYLLQSDLGNEFFNKKMKAFLKSKNMQPFITMGVTKNAHVERSILTFKNNLWRYFHNSNTEYWLDVYQKLVNSYNLTTHRSIGIPPASVNGYNYAKVHDKLYKEIINTPKKKSKLHAGNLVRLNLLLSPFSKKYEEKWSRAVYLIKNDAQYTKKGIYPVYKVTELDGTTLPGKYYEYELLRVPKKHFLENYVFPIEKVVSRGRVKSLVKFLGYSDKYNDWVENKIIKSLI